MLNSLSRSFAHVTLFQSIIFCAAFFFSSLFTYVSAERWGEIARKIFFQQRPVPSAWGFALVSARPRTLKLRCWAAAEHCNNRKCEKSDAIAVIISVQIYWCLWHEHETGATKDARKMRQFWALSGDAEKKSWLSSILLVTYRIHNN